MRNLTNGQKNFLRKWYKEAEPTKKEQMLFGKVNPIHSVEDLSMERLNKLQHINDSEVLYTNINGFLHDLRMEDL